MFKPQRFPLHPKVPHFSLTFLMDTIKECYRLKFYIGKTFIEKSFHFTNDCPAVIEDKLNIEALTIIYPLLVATNFQLMKISRRK